MRRRLRRLVWNRSERRLRTPWRLIAGITVLTLASVVGILALGLLSTVLGLGELLTGGGSAIQPLLITALSGLVIIVAFVPVGWFLDRRRLADYGLGFDRQWWVDCAIGLGIGAAAMTGLLVVGVAGGWITIVSVGLTTDTLSLFALLCGVFVVVGVYEELFVRGYLLTNLAEGFRWFEMVDHRLAVALATLFSSGVFGLFHFANPNATLLSTTVISAAGVMLALGYLYTGELAIPIGIHITWNAFQGLVYGFPVSGIELPVTVVTTASQEPAVVSGGVFGPEAGLLGLFGVGLAALSVVVYCRVQYGTIRLISSVSVPALREGSTE